MDMEESDGGFGGRDTAYVVIGGPVLRCGAVATRMMILDNKSG